MPHVVIEGDEVARPSTLQQLDLLKRVSEFFDGFYTALSHLSGCVARFSQVFPGGSVSNNGPFLEWLNRLIGDPAWKLTHEELQRARQFRALVSHPQQFPAYDWGTGTHIDYLNVHVILHGPLGRGKNPTPPGARRDDPFHSELGDWTFEAPDEVSVTNALFVGVSEIVARILVFLSAQSAFRRPRTIEEVRESFASAPVDVSERSRFVKVDVDRPTLDPGGFVPSSADLLARRTSGPLDKVERPGPTDSATD